MAKKVIRMDERQLNELVKESVKMVPGEIDSQSAALDEMARVGFLGGNLEVYVWTDDGGNIPHVHIRDTNSRGREFETCVRLDKADYFLHGHYKKKFNSSQKTAFAEFMKASPGSPRYKTNYELAVEMWNLNNSDAMVTPAQENGETVVPDYTKLP